MTAQATAERSGSGPPEPGTGPGTGTDTGTGTTAENGMTAGTVAGAGGAPPAWRGTEPSDADPQPPHQGPRADCTADRAGGLTFDVRLPAWRAREAGNAALLLRRRGGGDAATDTVRLPLDPLETGEEPQDEGRDEAREVREERLRAVLPSTMPLAEGRWDAYLDLAGTGPRQRNEPAPEPERLLPGLHDLRSLVDRTPRAGRTWLGVRIPYATKYGNLTVRSWLRWPHAEAGELRVQSGAMALRGRLYGAELTRTARLEARPREAGAPTVTVRVTREENGGRAGTGFSGTLPYRGLTGRRLWDLWLRPREGDPPVRIARILDDIADKKRIFTYPQQDVGTGARFTVRPYYTLDNDLSVRVDALGPAMAAQNRG